MKYSEAWLREWINPKISHDTLINQLTMAGFKVEQSFPIISNKFYGVVIAEIISIKIHPHLRKKWIITVNNGKKLINIISNNIYYQINAKVVVANIGALLPNGQKVLPIIISGELSEGILCSFSILDLNFYEKDIIELPDDAPIGCSFYDYLKLNDNIIDMDITPNRGDCLSIMGIAREIATINQLQSKVLTIDTIIPTIQDSILIHIDEPQICPKFLGKILKNINIATPTPIKIKEKLRRCGIQSINIITDISNYVLLELGYPIYIFDYAQIDSNTIFVRFSQPEETLTLSNNNIKLKLQSNTLIISDKNKPISIAGIITGNQSHVSLKTHDIFLQAAFFDPLIIAQQTKLYNLHTFSSIRYERGVDPNLSELALNYITELILKNCNGHVGPTVSIVHNKSLPKTKTIQLNHTRLNKILGFYISNKEVTTILKNLGFRINYFNNNLWTISTPTWRFDINIEANLISEIIRIYGYNKIPKIASKTELNQHFNYKTKFISLSKSKTTLINRGYQEIITYSFVNPTIQKLLHPQDTPLTLINPISIEMSVMRLTLWTGLIKTILYNQNRQKKNMQLFESGICFVPNEKYISQTLTLAGARFGLKSNEHWDSEKTLVDFYDIKGDVEAALNIINKNNTILFKHCTHPSLHPGQRSAIYQNNTFIGYIGMIHPKIKYQLNLSSNIFVFEIFWNAISKPIFSKISDISKFPKNYRDISIIVPKYISAISIIDTCKKLNINQLIEVQLIDLYIGNNIPIGFKSFTIKLTLQSTTHTLKEYEITRIVNKCVMTLQNIFHATLR